MSQTQKAENHISHITGCGVDYYFGKDPYCSWRGAGGQRRMRGDETGKNQNKTPMRLA